MSDQLVIAIGIKLLLGFVSAIISILLWSRTRDGAWLFMVIGVIFLYVKNILEVLDSFGFIILEDFQWWGLSIVPLIFESVPFLFFAIGMLVFLFRVRAFK